MRTLYQDLSGPGRGPGRRRALSGGSGRVAPGRGPPPGPLRILRARAVPVSWKKIRFPLYQDLSGPGHVCVWVCVCVSVCDVYVCMWGGGA